MTASALPSASLASLRSWFDIAPDAMIATDEEGYILLANAQAERMFGYERGTLRGLMLDALVPERLRHAHRMHRHDYATHPRVRPMGIGYELMGTRRDGQRFPVEVGLSPAATESGVVVIASVRDISETRRVQQAQQRAHRDAYVTQLGRLVLASSNHEVAIRQIPELVAAALDIRSVAVFSTDWHRSELRILASTGLSSHAEALASTFQAVRLIRTTFAQGGPDALTMKMLRGGRHASVAATLSGLGFHDLAIVPLFGSDEPLGALVALAPAPGRFDDEDIGFLHWAANLLAASVQRRRTEEQLAHAQRLDAIGQLTGGIAHDFNNLLTVISGNLQLLLESELHDRPGTREIIDDAMRAVDRGSNLTRRLLTFARRQLLSPRAVVPQPLLEELANMLRRALGGVIATEVDCPADVPDVFADPNELDAALVNLALNARDAMPRGGRLRIAGREVVLDTASNEWKLPAGRYVAFKVSDDGTGMPPDVRAHAIEPFFTTKDVQKGSGLGLSMVYGFVSQSGGAMAIDSQLGYGTHVTLMLPVAREPAGKRVDPSATRDAPTGKGDETVLVVEDEDDVRRIAIRFLRAVGYRVLSAASAREAVDILRGQQGVDLLFSDVVLSGGMNGVELGREARRVRPGLPVLLTSGYRRRDAAQQAEGGAEVFELLRKPYLREQLLSTIRRLLDAR